MGFHIALSGWYLLGLPEQCTINEFLQDKGYNGHQLICKNAIYIKKNATTNSDCVIQPSNPPGQIVIDDWGVIESSQMGTQKFNVSLGVWMEIEVICYTPPPPEPTPDPPPNPCLDSPAPCGCDDNEPNTSHHENANGEPCEPCEPGEPNCNCYEITYVKSNGEPCNPEEQSNFNPNTGEPNEPCIKLCNGEPCSSFEPDCSCPCDDDTQGGFGATNLSPDAISGTLANPPLAGYLPPLFDPPTGVLHPISLGLGEIALIANANLSPVGTNEPSYLTQILEEVSPHLTDNEPTPALTAGTLSEISQWYGSILDLFYASPAANFYTAQVIYNNGNNGTVINGFNQVNGDDPADPQGTIPILPIGIYETTLRVITPSVESLIYVLGDGGGNGTISYTGILSSSGSGGQQTSTGRILDNINTSISSISDPAEPGPQLANFALPSYTFTLSGSDGSNVGFILYPYYLFPPTGTINDALQSLSNEPLSWVLTA